MIRVYCYSRCSTCRKALKWLEEKGIAFEAVDLKEKHPSATKLKEYYKKSGLPLKRFFNTSGQQYRELGLSQKLPEMSEKDQLKLLAGNGMLVKRPLLIDGDTILVGFKEAEWEEALL